MPALPRGPLSCLQEAGCQACWPPLCPGLSCARAYTLMCARWCVHRCRKRPHCRLWETLQLHSSPYLGRRKLDLACVSQKLSVTFFPRTFSPCTELPHTWLWRGMGTHLLLEAEYGLGIEKSFRTHQSSPAGLPGCHGLWSALGSPSDPAACHAVPRLLWSQPGVKTWAQLTASPSLLMPGTGCSPCCRTSSTGPHRIHQAVCRHQGVLDGATV